MEFCEYYQRTVVSDTGKLTHYKCTRYLISIRISACLALETFKENIQSPKNMLLKKNNTYFEIMYIIRTVL